MTRTDGYETRRRPRGPHRAADRDEAVLRLPERASATSPTRTSARSASGCPARCRCSTARPSSSRWRSALALGCEVRPVVVPPQELLLSRHAEGLPDQPVRRADQRRRSPRRCPTARSSASSARTSRRTPARRRTSGRRGRIHGADRSLVDYNRAGRARSSRSSRRPTCARAAQARAYVAELRGDPRRDRRVGRADGGGLAAHRRERLGARAGRPRSARAARSRTSTRCAACSAPSTTRPSARSTLARRRAARSSKRRGTGTRARAGPSRCARRRRPTTTATSPSPTSSRSSPDDAWRDRVAASLPALPAARRAALVGTARRRRRASQRDQVGRRSSTSASTASSSPRPTAGVPAAARARARGQRARRDRRRRRASTSPQVATVLEMEHARRALGDAGQGRPRRPRGDRRRPARARRAPRVRAARRRLARRDARRAHRRAPRRVGALRGGRRQARPVLRRPGDARDERQGRRQGRRRGARASALSQCTPARTRLAARRDLPPARPVRSRAARSWRPSSSRPARPRSPHSPGRSPARLVVADLPVVPVPDELRPAAVARRGPAPPRPRRGDRRARPDARRCSPTASAPSTCVAPTTWGCTALDGVAGSSTLVVYPPGDPPPTWGARDRGAPRHRGVPDRRVRRVQPRDRRARCSLGRGTSTRAIYRTRVPRAAARREQRDRSLARPRSCSSTRRASLGAGQPSGGGLAAYGAMLWHLAGRTRTRRRGSTPARCRRGPRPVRAVVRAFLARHPGADGAHPSGDPRGPEARLSASAPTTQSMHAHSAATSSGSIAGNIAMRSWLRPSLRYGSVSTTPLRRSTPATASASTRVVEVDRRDDVAAHRGLLDERARERARLGPAVEDLGGAVAPRRREREAALLEHPAQLGAQQVQRRERRACCRSAAAASCRARS